MRLPLHRCSDSRYTGGQTPLHRWSESPATQESQTPVTQVVRLPIHKWSDSRYTGAQTPVTPVDRDSRYTGGQTPVTQVVRNNRYLGNEKADRLAKEAARSENMQHVFDRIPKSTSHHKAEEAKQECKPSGQRLTKRQPLNITFLQSRID